MRAPPVNGWSDAEVAFMVAARKNDVPFKEIGESLGRTETAAWNKWRKLNAAPSDSTAEASRGYGDIRPASNPDSPDSSTPKFANDAMHLRLMAEAMLRGEHRPQRWAA